MPASASPRSLNMLLPSSELLPQRVSMLYRLSSNDIAVIWIAALIAGFALWGYVDPKLLLAWIVWILGASVARYALQKFYLRKLPGPAEAARWEGYFCLVSTLVGSIWGLTVMLLYPGKNDLSELLVPVLIGSVAMGLPPSLAPSPKAFACFIVPIIAPLIAMLFTQGGAYNASAGLLLLVFSAVLLGLYLSSHNALMETLRFGVDNERLLQQVKIAKERLDLALQTSDLLIWEWDGREDRFYLDGSWRGVLGDDLNTRAQRLGDIAKMLHPDDQPRMKHALVACMKGSAQEYASEHRVKTLDGGWRWSVSRGRVVERDAGGRAVRMTGINIDIDKQKRAEAELLTAMQREKELSEMKSKFVSMASHEFRTPLATILSSAELLQHYAERLSGEEKSNLLQSIQNGAKRMGEMIDDVLVLGRAESGMLKLNPAPLNLRELCRGIIAEFGIAQGKQHKLRFDDRFDRAETKMDEKLLRHILNNLLSNAIKYSPPGSEVSMSLSRSEEHAIVEIQDQGIGIPEQDQARLFESFHRASNVGNRQGTGLGLSIVKKAVELHGGEIKFQSRPNAGTRFTVTLSLNCQTANGVDTVR